MYTSHLFLIFCFSYSISNLDFPQCKSKLFTKNRKNTTPLYTYTLRKPKEKHRNFNTLKHWQFINLHIACDNVIASKSQEEFILNCIKVQRPKLVIINQTVKKQLKGGRKPTQTNEAQGIKQRQAILQRNGRK